MRGFARAVDHVVTTIYNLVVLGGLAYLVGWKGWSGWWFAFALLVLARSSPEKPEEGS